MRFYKSAWQPHDSFHTLTGMKFTSNTDKRKNLSVNKYLERKQTLMTEKSINNSGV